MEKTTTNGKLGRLTSLVSTIVSRAQLSNRAGITFGNKRDLYAELGYTRTLDYPQYFDRYQRGGIASRIVDAFPTATWRNPPIVSVKENEEFQEVWDKLVTRLAIYHYLERVDKLAGIGRYAVVFFGTSGGRSAESPLPPVKGPEDLLFLSLFSEENAQIRALVSEVVNPRFGLPDTYNVQFIGGLDVNSRITAKIVHSSRVIHIAEGTLEDDVFGCPRLKKVWNYLDDLDKTIGASAEAVWKTVDRGIQFDLDKELDLTPEDEEDFAAEIEEYMHGQKRFFKTKGITTTVLGSTSIDPRGPVEALVGLISGTTGIPQRILMGSARGELSSGQDERNFNSRVRERQLSFAEPIVLRPFLDKLISINVLPEPDGPINIEWPDLAILTDKEAADIAARTGQAIKHVSDQAIMVLPPKLFAVKYLDIDPDEYDKAVEEAGEIEPIVPPPEPMLELEKEEDNGSDE